MCYLPLKSRKISVCFVIFLQNFAPTNYLTSFHVIISEDHCLSWFDYSKSTAILIGQTTGTAFVHCPIREGLFCVPSQTKTMLVSSANQWEDTQVTFSSKQHYHTRALILQLTLISSVPRCLTGTHSLTSISYILSF